MDGLVWGDTVSEGAWIPAYAGMTGDGAGMTGDGVGMT